MLLLDSKTTGQRNVIRRDRTVTVITSVGHNSIQIEGKQSRGCKRMKVVCLHCVERTVWFGGPRLCHLTC